MSAESRPYLGPTYDGRKEALRFGPRTLEAFSLEELLLFASVDHPHASGELLKITAELHDRLSTTDQKSDGYLVLLEAYYEVGNHVSNRTHRLGEQIAREQEEIEKLILQDPRTDDELAPVELRIRERTRERIRNKNRVEKPSSEG